MCIRQYKELSFSLCSYCNASSSPKTRWQFSAEQLNYGELQRKEWSGMSKVLEKSKGKRLEKRRLELTRRTSLVILERAIPAE